MSACSCLIPFYNENQRLLHVLKVATQLKNLKQIVCVDDGSTDGTSDLVARHYPQVTLLRLKKNLGKTQAIKAGLKLVNTEYVLLLDADLKFLKADEIERAIKEILQTGIDMIILKRFAVEWLVKLNRGDIIFSGERILKTNDLQQTLAHSVKSYQLEVAINDYMIKHHKLVKWMPSSARNTYKVLKWGPMHGLKKDYQMYSSMIAYLGLKNYFQQVFTFCKLKV